MFFSLFTIIFIQSWFCSIVQPLTQTQIPGSRPAPVAKPVYTDSYIPASMHVILHLADLMKYDISAINKPQKPQKVTTTTVRSTVPHKPGVYAPLIPTTTMRNLLNQNKKDTIENSEPLKVSPVNSNQLTKELLYLDEAPKIILNQINKIDDEDSDFIDDDGNDFNLERFVKDYDNLREEFLRLPRVPPTSAYVSLLSLYDALNKEAKRQGLNRFNGYSTKVLETLINTSSGSAIDQLKFVLNKVVDNSNTKTPEVVNKIKRLLSELDRDDGLIAKAIRYYPPMKFSS